MRDIRQNHNTIIIQWQLLNLFWKAWPNIAHGHNNSQSVSILYITIFNAFFTYGGWVPKNMGDWNCWPQTQTARTPKSHPYLQPSHEPRLPEKSCPCPSTRHTELEEQWKPYWVNNDWDYIKNIIRGDGVGNLEKQTTWTLPVRWAK